MRRFPLPPFWSRVCGALALGVVLSLPACTGPPSGRPPRDDGSRQRVAAAGPTTRIADARIRTVLLHRTDDETSLPVLTLGRRETLSLSFDVLGNEIGQPLEITFAHTDRNGRSDLLPTEFLTGFERDDLVDYRPSGARSVPYVHYDYSFPNGRIGFKLSGSYQLRVSVLGGETLFEAPFFVSEEAAEVDVGFGGTVQGGSVGFSIQPYARLRPGPRLEGFDGFQYTVCFARDGQTQALRCAPNPSLLDVALLQFYLPRQDAFPPSQPVFALDLGLLAPNPQVLDVDRSARPPTATLDLDYAEFGGDPLDADQIIGPSVAQAFRDGGSAATDAQYVATRFRYVPPRGGGGDAVYVVGQFNNWTRSPDARLTWTPDVGRYEGSILLKQGRYTYRYVAAGDTPVPFGVNQRHVYTAFVFLEDPQLFTQRLVAVASAVAR